jgi:thiamine biosynthesis lipoprotein
MARSSFEAIGTAWTIDIYDDLPADQVEALFGQLRQRIRLFDDTYSRFRPDSLVGKIAKEAGRYILPDDAGPLFDTYRQFYELTDGAMTPLVGSLLSDSGYDATYTLRPKAGPQHEVPVWGNVMAFDPPVLTISQPVLLDFGAAGKGYLVDLLSEILEAHGIRSYCLDAGGDIRQRHVSRQNDRIGLEHPLLNGQIIGVATLGDRSLCGSATNRRTWSSHDGHRLHHIVDPRSLKPTEGIAAIWAVADSTLFADALTTALFFADPATLRAGLPDAQSFDYAILYDSPSGLRLEHSSGFPAEFYTTESRE